MPTIYQNTPAKSPDSMKMSLSRKKMSLIDELLDHEPNSHSVKQIEKEWDGYSARSVGRTERKKGGSVFPAEFNKNVMDKVR